MNAYNTYLFALAIGTISLFLVLVAYERQRSGHKIVYEKGRFNLIHVVLGIVAYSTAGIVCTHMMSIETMNGAYINIRDVIVVFASMFGGPAVGIPTGMIVGFDRFLLGGDTAIPCAISAMLSGVIASVLWYVSGKKYPKILPTLIMMIAIVVIHMGLIMILVVDGSDFVKNSMAYIMIGSCASITIVSWLVNKKIKTMRGL